MDVCVTSDIPPALRCLKKGARVVSPTGKQWTDANIGNALAPARTTFIPMARLRSRRFGVIGAAMAQAGIVGLGRLTLSRRERMVMVEPRGTGMALFTLRAAGEVRAPQFGSIQGDLDAEMVAIAGTIIRQRTGNFDPSVCRDRYQEMLQQLIEAKMKGVTIEPRAVSTPSPVIDLMAALKRSLAQEPSAPKQRTAKRKQTKKAPDRRQPVLLLPLTGSRKGERRPSAAPAVASMKKRIASIKKRSRGA
jgi:hypothetical protein